jgi:hypothetical protein
MQPFLKFYYSTFMYSSTCFGHPHAHNQEINTCGNSLWFYHCSVVVAVLLVVVGPAGPTTTNSVPTAYATHSTLKPVSTLPR